MGAGADSKTEDSWKLAYFYSIYQFGLVITVLLFQERFSAVFVDYVKAMSLVIAGAWVMLYASVGPGKVVHFYHKTLKTTLRVDVPTWLLYVADITLHLLPCIILGLPSNPWTYPAAFLFLVAWYTFARPHIVKMYGFLPTRWSDFAVFAVGPALVVALVVLQYAFMSRKNN